MARSNRKFKVVAVLGAASALSGAGSATLVAGGGGAAAAATSPPQIRRGAFGGTSLPTSVRAVAQKIFDAIRAQAPAIAKPLLDQGVAAGTITAAQEDQFLTRLSQPLPDPRSGPPSGSSDGASSVPPPAKSDGNVVVGPSGAALTTGQRQLYASVFGAIRKQAPAIAKPLLDQAVADGTITQARADQISARLTAERVRLGLRDGAVRAGRRGDAVPVAGG
jgi:hypothetical protein